ncbi:MAG TPA: ribosomal protein L7/L12 [Polyangiaceae bacterium]|nr:ribosomal protein L7/L12 [Polyangiaceae bacterium]
MPSRYTDVRRQWRATDPERDLARLWRAERFEEAAAIEEALRVYELAVRVAGWEAVKGWARAAFDEGRILNAHLVELSMRAFEQRDVAFVAELTARMLDRAPPSFFRFWYTLFCTRHSHAGEKIFRAQLAALSDYHAVKYRRWLRKILRKLRFRCETPREKAQAAIAFGAYRGYDKEAYPSEVFEAYLACHKAASTRPKGKQDRPVSAEQHAAHFARAAAKLGIWSVVEGVRTSAKLPRTLAYLAAMAPGMTDLELRRSLKAFDARLKTATHKKAPEDVVELAGYLRGRLAAMPGVALEEWCKVYPYLASPTLCGVVEDVVDARLGARGAPLAGGVEWGFAPIVVPETLEARAFRAALVVAYLLYGAWGDAALYLVRPGLPRLLAPPSPLWPYGAGVLPGAARWGLGPDRPHRPFYDLVRGTFPEAAKRRATSPLGADGYVQALRHHLYRRQVLDGAAPSRDVPLLVLTGEPEAAERRALAAHLAMFPAAALVKLDAPWKHPLDGPHLAHLYAPAAVNDLLAPLAALEGTVADARAAFAARKLDVDRALRHLLLAPAPAVELVAQGPYEREAVGAKGAPPPGPSAAEAPPVPAAPTGATVDVVLVRAKPDAKIMLIKAVREATGLGLKEAKDLVEGVPKPLRRGLPRPQAERVKAAIEAAGGGVELRPPGR